MRPELDVTSISHRIPMKHRHLFIWVGDGYGPKNLVQIIDYFWRWRVLELTYNVVSGGIQYRYVLADRAMCHSETKWGC